MKKMISITLAGVMALGMVACGGTKTDTSAKASQSESAAMTSAGTATDASAKGSESAAAQKVKVAVVYSGNLGDKSYNDSCNIGSQKAAQDFGVEIKNLEGTTAEEWKANFLAAAEGGYDLVILSSSNFQTYLEEYASQYPDVKFAIIDTTVKSNNVLSVSFAQNQGSFLAGAAAAMFTTKTDIPGVNSDKTIGWVGGMDIPVLRDFFTGYEQGAKYIDKDIKILQSFAGTWNDPLKGKELTLAQYESGADIVMNVASGTGPGILEAAKQAGKYAIGVDLNQDNDQPGSILTSMVKRVDTAAYTVIKSVVENTFKGGSSLYLEVKDGGVSLTDFSVIKKALGDKFPQDIVDKTTELADKIAKGEITVTNFEGFGPAN